MAWPSQSITRDSSSVQAGELAWSTVTVTVKIRAGNGLPRRLKFHIRGEDPYEVLLIESTYKCKRFNIYDTTMLKRG